MATSNIAYCTGTDLKDVYPHIDEFDQKTPIYGWEIDDNYGYAYNTGVVSMLYSDGKELGAAQTTSGAVDAVGKWFYDSDADRVWYYFGNSNTSPNDKLMESGTDWSTLKTKYIKNASRYFDSRVDANLPRDQWKDKEGNYDYLVVRTTALIACSFMLRAHQPENTQGLELMKEAEFNIEKLNKGEAKLSNQVTADSSEGILREVVSPQNANPLRIVETKGQYTGTYDLLKIVIPASKGGAIGTGKYDVYCKDSDGLKNNKIVTEETITGDYQHIGFGIHIRWAGLNASSTADANDEYELELWGINEKVDNPQTKHTVSTRGGGLHARNRGINL